VLGYLDPENFLDGAMMLDAEQAYESVRTALAEPLDLTPEEAAAAVLEVATENMVNAIEDITMSQGVDTRSAVLISGGGSGGFYAGSIGRRIGCPRVLIPGPAAALSAVGALMSDLVGDFAVALPASTSAFPQSEVNAALEGLERSCLAFASGPGAGSIESEILFSVEARYPQQIWDLEVPLQISRFRSEDDLEELRSAFHRIHEETLGIADPGSEVEVTIWRAKVRCATRRNGNTTPGRVGPPTSAASRVKGQRPVFFADLGWVETPIRAIDELPTDSQLGGPIIINARETTIIVRAGMSITRLPSGSIQLIPGEPD
jgi:N-methylhydantoinase A